jgi:hypothetical protein
MFNETALTEISLGATSLSLAGISFIAQSSTLPEWAQLIPHFGGLAFAVWLVIHHTTVTMPSILKEHKDERLAIIAEFKKERIEALGEFHTMLEAQQRQFGEMLKEVSKKE